MTESKTKPISLRVRTDVLDALEAAGIAPADVAREALEKAAVRAKQMAALERIRSRKDKFVVGFDVVGFIRKDRDTHA